MYGWLWRHLPGHWSVRLVQLAVLAAGVVALLMYVVFPAADPHLPFNDVTVNNPSTPTPPSIPASTPAATPTPTPTPSASPTATASTSPTGAVLPGD
jgi:cytoskeletal protein RodZ